MKGSGYYTIRKQIKGATYLLQCASNDCSTLTSRLTVVSDLYLPAAGQQAHARDRSRVAAAPRVPHACEHHPSTAAATGCTASTVGAPLPSTAVVGRVRPVARQAGNADVGSAIQQYGAVVYRETVDAVTWCRVPACST